MMKNEIIKILEAKDVISMSGSKMVVYDVVIGWLLT